MADKELIECQECNWLGTTGSLEAPFSGMEPSCPVCQATDFLDLIVSDLEATVKEEEMSDGN